MNALKNIFDIINPTNVATLRARIANYAMAAIAGVTIVYQLLAQLGVELPGVGCKPCAETTIEAQ